MSTYEEYLALRQECGYPEENAMTEAVWSKCEPGAQQDMLAQLRVPAAKRLELDRRYHVDAW